MFTIIMFLIAVYIIVSEWYWDEKRMREAETTLCPHGYEDWDDCPDCRH